MCIKMYLFWLAWHWWPIIFSFDTKRVYFDKWVYVQGVMLVNQRMQKFKYTTNTTCTLTLTCKIFVGWCCYSKYLRTQSTTSPSLKFIFILDSYITQALRRIVVHMLELEMTIYLKVVSTVSIILAIKIAPKQAMQKWTALIYTNSATCSVSL